MRRLVVLLALACAGAQSAAGSTLFSSALALGILGSHHAHSISVVAEQGHLHLVLSHADRDAHHPGPVSHHDDLQPVSSESDHVFEIGVDDATRTSPGRALLDPGAPIATIVGAPFVAAQSAVRRSPPEPRARGVDDLRTVVLRL